MAQSKEDQFNNHIKLLKKKMDENAWGQVIFFLQDGYIVQGRMIQTYVIDIKGKGLISQEEAETRAATKKSKRKEGYRMLNVVDTDNEGGDS